MESKKENVLYKVDGTLKKKLSPKDKGKNIITYFGGSEHIVIETWEHNGELLDFAYCLQDEFLKIIGLGKMRQEHFKRYNFDANFDVRHIIPNSWFKNGNAKKYARCELELSDVIEC